MKNIRQIKSSVRDDFKRGLQNIMREKHAEFADGTLEDNMIDIYDNYVSQYYEEELKEEGGEAVAEDWFRNTYYDDEEGIFIHNSRRPNKSIQSRVYVGEDGKQYYDPSDENQRYSDCFRWVLDQFHSYDNTTPKEIADAAVEYERRTGYYTDREDLVAAVMNELYALYGSEDDYEDDEIQTTPDDFDDDDYDYGDWESGRPMYSGKERNIKTLNKIFS